MNSDQLQKKIERQRQNLRTQEDTIRNLRQKLSQAPKSETFTVNTGKGKKLARSVDVSAPTIKQALKDYFQAGYAPHSDLVPTEVLLSKGLSRDGINWMVNYLDPNGEHNADPSMIPDALSGSRIVKPQVFDLNVSSPTDLKENETWDLLVYTLPFIEAFWLIVKKKSTDQWPDIAAATWDINDNTKDISIWYFPEYKDDGNYTTVEATHHRLVSRGTTSKPTGALLSQAGQLYEGQFPPEIEWGSSRIAASTEGGGAPKSVTVIASTVGQIYWRLPPHTPAQITSVDRLSRSGSALDGGYLPLRTSTSSGIPDMRSTIQGGQYVVCNHDAVKYNDEKNWHISTHHLSNPGTDWNVGVTVYTGLASKEVVHLKLRGCQEFSPRAKGPLLTMARLAPTPDLTAIKLASLTTHHLRHSYPASYNDMSGLLGVLGNIFKKVVRPLAGPISNLGIPVVSPIAGGIDKIASLFGS